MTLKTRDFDYELPINRIAQTPAVPRESAKLMVVNRHTHTYTHTHIANFPDYLKKGDVLVVNNTKVFHARLKSGNKELFLIRPIGNNLWSAIGRNLKPGANIAFSENFIAHILEKQENGEITVSFNTPDVVENANIFGEVPVPPYIKTLPKDSDYQTVYAKFTGSVAAPTAGFHLTKPLLETIKAKGVTILEITLHVGLGTFMPIKSDTLDTHTMHSEWVEVKPEVSKQILQAKKEGRRIIAVGTTTVRTLEGTGAMPFTGDVNLFIQPGYTFKVVDAMLTNFHLPKSTLIVLVSAFANRELILHAYTEAVAKNYRFYSFGDAMFIE
jgi:S-adenosylmethionine:tRNA ribosyltransferase-isomerase